MDECVVPVISYVPLKHPESDSFIKFFSLGLYISTQIIKSSVNLAHCYSDFISLNDFPFIFFHTAGPLTLYPVTKSAAAEELENNISSVVMCSSLTSPDAICFSRIAFMPFDRDFPDVFSLIPDPFRTTNPSEVISPTASAVPILR